MPLKQLQKWILAECKPALKRVVALIWQRHMNKYTVQVPLFGNPYQELTPSSCLCSCHALGRFIPIVASRYNENTLDFVGGGKGNCLCEIAQNNDDLWWYNQTQQQAHSQDLIEYSQSTVGPMIHLVNMADPPPLFEFHHTDMFLTI